MPWIRYAHIEFAANILYFVPFGVLVTLVTRRWWLAALAGLVVSVAVEAVQGLLLSARVASAMDVVANSIGTLVGAILAGIAMSVAASRRRRARPSP